MKNRKFLKWIGWCMGIILVMGISGLFVADYTVTKFMSVMASDSNGSQGTTNSTLQEDPPISKELSKSVTSNDSPSAVEGGEGASEQSAVSTQDQEIVQDKDKEQVQVQVQDKDVGANHSSHVTDQQVNEVQDTLTTGDKAQIISIIASSLNRSSSEKLWGLAKGGLTVAEKQEAKELLLTELSSDDYNTLSELAKEYGISKGKTYDEAKRELNLQP
ncbi:hypothetical protein J2T13_001342 [Paenibacillus sp. DS2015]|uniref:hypothetical protein n=1 Tax=Paenibacillus sp. DS2015 TaxID=3373917 RepID=UPI003D1C18AF